MTNIQNFIPRLYQEKILAASVNKNLLIVLPTGLGKTKTSIMIAVHRLNNFPNSKILFLTPTKPLTNQITKELQDCTDVNNEKIISLTGSTPPKKRKQLIENATILISTPQTIASDLMNKRISLENFSLIVFDEAHKATGNYDYVFIADQYNKTGNYPKIIALTASPGSDLEKIKEICQNLFIEDLEVKTREDPDVAPYIQNLEIEYIYVELPESIIKIKDNLEICKKSKLKRLKEIGYLDNLNINKTQLLELQNHLRGNLIRGTKDFKLWEAISLAAQIMKIEHGLELLECQGIHSFYKYMHNFFTTANKTKIKANLKLVQDLYFKTAYIQATSMFNKGTDHPKQEKIKEIIDDEIKIDPNFKAIVFTNFRESALKIKQNLDEIKNCKSNIFVGQMKKGTTGLSQKEQINIIKQFHNNEFNVLIATSIAEEGLDIPSVNLVVFYEAIPSAIRQIQRRGRTARLDAGKVILMITKNTRDEIYRWSAHHKENRMYRLLKDLKPKLFLKEQPKLNDYEIKDKNQILIDIREQGSNLIKELINLELNVKTDILPAADIIINNIGIERKTKDDFLASIIDKRLVSQLKALKDNFEKQLLIIEGEEDIYSLRKIHPNAIKGMLSTIALDFKIPIIYTNNVKDTVGQIKNIADREFNPKRDANIKFGPKPLSTKEQQEFIIASLPGIGPKLSKELLLHFKSVKDIINANIKDLQKIELIGPAKAKEIKRILDEKY